MWNANKRYELVCLLAAQRVEIDLVIYVVIDACACPLQRYNTYSRRRLGNTRRHAR